MSGAPLVVVGDALLDRDLVGRAGRLCPDAPAPVVDLDTDTTRPGGAALTAALAATDGVETVLVTALAADPAGRELRRHLERFGVEVVDLGVAGPTPEKIRVRADGQVLVRIDRGARPSPPGPWTDTADAALRGAAAVLVSDYGRGVAAGGGLAAALAAAGGPVVWDPHPRGAAPPPGVLAVCPNAGEVLAVAGVGHREEPTLHELTEAGRRARRAWGCAAVVVTRGREGALVVDGDGPPLAVPATPAAGDTCGAGDRFAATLATGLGRGLVLSEAAVAATAAASAQVAAGGPALVPAAAGSPPGPGSAATSEGRATSWSRAAAADLCASARAAGRRVAVAGGCFDVLHAGHLSLLRAAAALADVLVVAVNSDRSVTALKGPGRPVVPEADRLAVLSSIAGVDAVCIFDEATPAAVLEELRPDVFVKGGDYAHGRLPEEDLLARWGGQAVVVPYLDGRSTTLLLEGRSGVSP